MQPSELLTPEETDLVVVGSGRPFMAIMAAQQGKKVIVLEKMPIIGGNTRGEGGMNAARTIQQLEHGIMNDSVCA